MSPVPVFMYHHVSPHRGDMVTVTPDVLEAQMRFLKEAGYRTLSAEEIVSHAGGKSAVSGKAVAITFDDGYLDNYMYAFPILKKYNIKTTIFIVIDWVEKSSEFVIAKGFSPEAISVDKIASPEPALSEKARLLRYARNDESEGARNDKTLPNHNECKRLINEGKTSEVIMNWDMIKEMQQSGLVDFYSHTMSHRKCAEISEEELIK
ncbi:MAG: polysaccharide deacetylase family protein, partial [Deltaproteobacteria bacterium]|nr:polysaccharide deacetylase family protein [Deltaproteobacteria bacterium]